MTHSMTKKPLKKVIKTDNNTIKGIYNLARAQAVRYLNSHPSVHVEVDDLVQSGMESYLRGRTIIYGIIQGYSDASPLKRIQCGSIPFPKYQEIEEDTLSCEAPHNLTALLSQVWDSINQFDARTADIMHRRFKQGQTLKQIGAEYTLTEGGVKFIIDNTISTLKKRLR